MSKRVTLENLKTGMVLSTDVYNSNDQLILPEGLELNQKAIEKLMYYEIEAVRINDEDEKPVKEISYSEKLKSTPEFKQYKKDFENTVGDMSDMLSDVVMRNAPLDSEKLVESAFKLLHPAGGNVGVFDMLHNMRDYDDFTFAHSLSVGLICNVFARWLNMSEEEQRVATECGILHDIGKLKIPEEVIKKTERLSDMEYEIYKIHTKEGYKLLEQAGVSDAVKNATLMHHERCDGSGYPLGLTDKQIDPYAKLVAIADDYETMTSKKNYGGEMCPFRVIEAFEAEGYQKYDARMIITFLQNIVNTYVLNHVLLSDGREGEIIFINKQSLSKPIVKCGDEYVDLSKEKDIIIEKLI